MAMPEIRDGDAFSFSLGSDAQPCIVYPPSLFDRASCPRDAKPLTEPPKLNPESRVLMLGSVRADDAGGPARATVIATVTQLSDNTEPGVLQEFAHGMADGLVKSKSGAKLRTGPEAKLVTVGGVHVARIVFDVDGLSAQGLDHVVSYAAWSETGDYTITFMANPAHGPAVDAIADQLATTMHVAHPAPPKSLLRGRGIGGTLLGAMAALAVPAIVWFVVSNRRKRAAAATQPG
jgi:hypothetical protein